MQIVYNNYGHESINMNSKIIQKIALDSCVVIDLMEKPGLAQKFRRDLRGKPIHIVLCDVVLSEVHRVRNIEPGKVISKISKILGKKIELITVNEEEKCIAKNVSANYQICHKGDNLILALCKIKDFVLVTFDKMLLRSCEFVGVAAFHPATIGGI